MRAWYAWWLVIRCCCSGSWWGLAGSWWRLVELWEEFRGPRSGLDESWWAPVSHGWGPESRDEALWIVMRACESWWGAVNRHEGQWVLMRHCESSWGSVSLYEELWIVMRACESWWGTVSCVEGLWVVMRDWWNVLRTSGFFEVVSESRLDLMGYEEDLVTSLENIHSAPCWGRS